MNTTHGPLHEKHFRESQGLWMRPPCGTGWKAKLSFDQHDKKAVSSISTKHLMSFHSKADFPECKKLKNSSCPVKITEGFFPPWYKEATPTPRPTCLLLNQLKRGT